MVLRVAGVVTLALSSTLFPLFELSCLLEGDLSLV